MNQQRLQFPTPKRPTRGERLEEENRAAARIVLRGGESIYGAGLVRWARLTLNHIEDEHAETSSSEK